MKNLLKTVSFGVAVWLATVGAVSSVQAAEAPREDASAKVCVATARSTSATWDTQSAAAAAGYCTVDCSRCVVGTTECQRRGAGSCSPVSACRQPSAQ